MLKLTIWKEFMLVLCGTGLDSPVRVYFNDVESSGSYTREFNLLYLQVINVRSTAWYYRSSY